MCPIITNHHPKQTNATDSAKNIRIEVSVYLMSIKGTCITTMNMPVPSKAVYVAMNRPDKFINDSSKKVTTPKMVASIRPIPNTDAML
tara:strand:- start:1279 stop:1542 length:264 start_codon:yes stop_codon:yes gene_type:complete